MESRSALFEPCSDRKWSRKRASSTARPHTEQVTRDRRWFASPGAGVGIIQSRFLLSGYKTRVADDKSSPQRFIKRFTQPPSNFGVVA
jgi:hypothetical protein